MDTTANQETYHVPSNPAQNVDLRAMTWSQISGLRNHYFLIPNARFGHGLVAGSSAPGVWSPVSQGYAYGTYGTNGAQVPLNWFVGSAPAGTGDFSLADRHDGMRAPLNQTNTVGATWVHDYTVYPLFSVTFYLPAAEVRNKYVLHYEIPGQVPSAATQWPVAVAAEFSTATVNAGTQTIPVGAAKVTGIVALGANFKLVRNIDGYATAPIALTSALAYSATPKVWSLPLAPASVTRVPVTFGIASARSGQTFTVAQDSSLALTSPLPGDPALRPILSYEDYALDNTPNFFDYFVITALLDPDEPFNLMAQTPTGTEPFSAGQVWVLDGWTVQSGQPGPLPVGPPGEFRFELKVPGSEPADALTLVSPSGSSHALIPSALSNITLDDFWHPGTPWTTTETTWTLTLPYTGPLGDWSLAKSTFDHDWTLSLNVGNTTNYLREIKYQAKVRPAVLEISLSRWPFDTTPRLRLRQRDGSDFPVAARATTQWTSLAADATAWNSSAFSFTADTFIRDGVGYWVYDEETGEESPCNVTNLINWFALPTPAGLTGTVNPNTGAITLQWPRGFAAPEGAFEIERQLSGYTGWQTIDTLAASTATADVLHFSDPHPVVGKVHSYRVRYTYGSGSAFSRSARSNLVALTEWQDSDDDGIPDWWEFNYGLNPYGAADALVDSDNDGIVNFQEHLNATDPHLAESPDGDSNGGDGVSAARYPTGDPSDDYPDDPARKEAFGLRHYGLIDIWQSMGATPSNTNVYRLAVSDTHQVSMLSDLGNAIGRTYTVTQWDAAKSIQRTSTLADNRYEDATQKKVVTNYPLDLSGSGTLVGRSDSISPAETSGSSRGFYPLPGSSNASYYSNNEHHSSIEKISSGGLFYGRGLKKKTQPDEHFVNIPLVRSIWKTQQEGLFGTGTTNTKGDALGVASWGTYPNYYYVWDNSGLTQVGNGGSPYSINKDIEIVGRSNTYDANGYPESMHWRKLTGTIYGSHLEIPSSVSAQFRSVSPFLINDDGKIVFGAQFKLGDGAGTWQTGTGFLANSDTTTQTTTEVALAEFGGGKSVAIHGQNQKGTLCGIHNGRPVLAVPVEFQPVDNDALNHGFDYPILDDHNPGSPPDQLAPEWWVSVARSNVSGQQRNVTKVKVVFASKAAAQLCEIYIPAESKDLISVGDDEKALTTMTTVLTIEGKDPAGKLGPRPATIQVRTKDNSHQVLQTLNVQVLPEYRIKLAISFIEDNNSLLTTISSNDKNQGARDAIRDRLNEVFRQAYLYFVDVTPNDRKDYHVPYDIPPKNGILDAQTDSALEKLVVEGEAISQTVHLLIVREIARSAPTDVAFTALNTTRSIVGAFNCGNPANLATTCAHEVGHQLLRNLGARRVDNDVNNRHDATGQPRRYSGFTLMYPSLVPGFNQRWIRHEDWKPINEKGEELKIIP